MNEKDKKQLIVVVALIRDEKGRILLQKRFDKIIPEAHEKWEFPGGRIDFAETPEETVIRECREEINCEIKIIKLLPLVQSHVWQTSTGGQIQAVVFCYEAEIIKGIPKSSDAKVGEVAWFNLAELEKINTLPGIKDLIAL